MSSPKVPSSKRKRRIAIAACVAAAYAVGTIVATRQGYSFGLNVVARCRQGHLFTTMWIPGASGQGGPAWSVAGAVVPGRPARRAGAPGQERGPHRVPARV